MSVSLFDTRTMLTALEQMHPPKTFLLDTFFREENQATTEYVDIDIIKGKRKVASFTSPLDKAEVVARAGYTTNSIKLPYIKEKMKTTAEDFLKRQAGNNMYVANANPVTLAIQQEGKDLAYIQDMIVRREELMAAQALDTGIITMTGSGINATVNFGMDATHKIAVEAITAWSEASADPLENLKTWSLTVQKDSGLIPEIIIMGLDAAKYFIANTIVQKYMDMLRVEMGQIKPELLPSGAHYLGTVNYPGLYCDIYTYAETYLDSNGDSQYYVPVKKVWLGTPKARCTRQYGAIQDVEFGAVPTRFFPKSWVEHDPSVRWLMVQSAPLPCMHQPDAFLSAAVLA